jgi:succinate dehydrogenase/fumarate reductase flavoprotein subunit
MGVQIRDVHGEFKGAAFRDDETGLMFAYDYRSKYDLRVYGYNVKPCLHREMKRLGVEILDRVMVTSLLTAEGAQGPHVIGATGLHTRTGEFMIVQAKATVLATGLPGRLWLFSTENRPTFRDPNLTGDGTAAAWNAGAAFARLEESYPDGSPLSYIAYGVGNAHNTWHGCSIVDANGKEVPWVDRDGHEFETIAERFQPSPGQAFMVGHGLRIPPSYENHVRALAPDLPERIRNDEFVLPLYADLSRLPEQERRAIFGLMVGNEGKTRIPVYETLTRAGFDPDCDMLQAPVMHPDAYRHANFWAGMPVPLWRQWGTGGLLVDWDLRTSLEGLYAAGGAVYGGGAHSSAAAGGRYAGRKAALYTLTAREFSIDLEQVKREKARVYAPLAQRSRSIGWKELNAGICRIMQDYCGQIKSQETLELGLRLLQELKESEATTVYAANPHELARAVECQSILTVGEAVIHACLARKASSKLLNFFRLDYPKEDPPEWQKLLLVRQVRGTVTTDEMPLDYHLRPPFAPSYEENYQLCCGL